MMVKAINPSFKITFIALFHYYGIGKILFINCKSLNSPSNHMQHHLYKSSRGGGTHAVRAKRRRRVLSLLVLPLMLCATQAFAADNQDIVNSVNAVLTNNQDIIRSNEDVFILLWYFTLFCAWAMGFSKGLTR